MKALIPFLCFVAIFFLPKVYGQESDKYNFMPFDMSSVSGVRKGTAFNILLDSLGRPDSIKYSYDPITMNDTLKKFYYGSSCFEIKNGVIKEFLINDDCFNLKYKNIKVGNNINKLKRLFPVSYKNRYYPRNDSTAFMMVALQNKNIHLDAFIRFRIKKGKIIAFGYWEPL